MTLNFLSRIRVGQIVTVQVALALLVAASGRGAISTAAAALVAAALGFGAWIRLRRRWLFEWLAAGLRYLSRRHGLAPAADPVALLGLVAPGAQVQPMDLGNEVAAVVADDHGLTAVLELGNATGLLADPPQTLPAPASLLPAAGPQVPPIRIQLLLSSAPAPAANIGGGTAGASYRQLTDGRVPAREQAFLAVRVLRADDWSDDELRRALSSTVRKIRRRLRPVPARPLGENAALRVLAETAHHDGAQPARETWQAIHLGGLLQATFRLRARRDLGTQADAALVPRLLALPATATTVSLVAGLQAGSGHAIPIDMTVRLAASNAMELSSAGHALQRLLTTAGGQADRLDGDQLDGLAATLPLGLDAPGPPLTADLGPVVRAGVGLPLVASGLMIGTNRHGAPVIARLFRAESTRAVLIGGLPAAQLIALRAMALGARLVVQTARPQAWEPFLRGAVAPGETIAVIPPGRAAGGPPGTALHPLLVVIDIGPVTAEQQPGAGWQTGLVVRDELAAVDRDTVSRADLVLLQPLRPPEAALAASALGLGPSADWLTRIREDMVAVFNRRALRWALLSATSIESQLVGRPARS